MSRHVIHGNTQGLQPSQRKALERTYRRRVSPREVVSAELARHLAEISGELGRQVGVLVSRDGAIRNVIVGDAAQLMLPDIGRLRGRAGRFRGLRLVHTHLKGEPLTADDLNDLALLRLDMVAMVEVTGNGRPGRVEVAYLDPSALVADDDDVSGNGGAPGAGTGAVPDAEHGGGPLDPFLHARARNVQELDLDFQSTIAALENEFARAVRSSAGAAGAERALVIGIRPDDDHFAETLELVRSADVVIAGTSRQRRRRIHPKTVVGRGKLQEIVLEAMRRNAEVAIFDIDLKPAQARAFEDATGLKAIDRTQLILDVFAQRARSGDGKLQVELAQLRYSLPRLTEKDAGLSRLTGGIGGRGPGETVMEIGRRRIRDRIRALEKRVKKLSKQRDLRRRRRRREGIPVLSIIGYTNAGKSTLLNALTNSEIEVADKLFVTLDPTSRRQRFPRQGEVVITDTVGFIADLPEDLIAAFRATLEELADANLLLHVIDAADPRIDAKIAAVESLLDDLGLRDIPILRVLNKIDLLPDGHAVDLARRFEAVAVSAADRSGLDALMKAAEERLGSRSFDPPYAAPAVSG
ncbi:MAG: GTPase HflX [Acidobacteria bacterium]|nr:GTPase HflX [Acidobacteriota bacterium]